MNLIPPDWVIWTAGILVISAIVIVGLAVWYEEEHD